jgi:hypothetical protein
LGIAGGLNARRWQAGGRDSDDLGQTASDPGPGGAQKRSYLSHIAVFLSHPPETIGFPKQARFGKWSGAKSVSRPRLK